MVCVFVQHADETVTASDVARRASVHVARVVTMLPESACNARLALHHQRALNVRLQPWTFTYYADRVCGKRIKTVPCPSVCPKSSGEVRGSRAVLWRTMCVVGCV